MNVHLKYRDYIVKSGAIISTVGVIMIILFGLILLIFPVIKSCEKTCVFISTAPEYFRQLINPLFLFISLLLISLGIFSIRIGKLKTLDQRY
jgi:hypothetical protein